MRRAIFAAVAVATAVSYSPVSADGNTSHSYRANQALISAARDGAGHLAVIANVPRAALSRAQNRVSSGTRRLVYVDGVLIEMDETFLRGQIESGTFTVVYPGTSIPWTKSDDRHPNYPPVWF